MALLSAESNIKGWVFIMLTDFHIHSTCSSDAHDKMADMALASYDRGVRLMCFTDHVDLDNYSTGRADEHCFDVWPEILRQHAETCAAVPADMEVRCGIELGQGNHDLARAEQIASTDGLDFVIGSLHNLRDTPDFSVLRYISMSDCRQYLALYVSELLELSHLDLLSALLDGLSLPHGAREAILACVKQKNAHDLLPTAERASLGSADVDRLLTLITAPGTVPEALSAARRAAQGGRMRRAADALERLCDALCSDRVRLDFSIVSDTAYYNGVAFRGYVQGAPVPVLRGGEYDNLLERMGKGAMRAIGFALYLGELARCLPAPAADDGGTLLLYDPAMPPERVRAAVEARVAAGERVTALTEAPAGGRFARTVDLRKEGPAC